MTFKHKLSSRLALLKDRVVLASLAGLVTAAIVACELPVRATDPGSTIADLLVSPKTLTLRQNATADFTARSEEHTSELQSQSNLVCRLLLEKKKKKKRRHRKH